MEAQGSPAPWKALEAGEETRSQVWADGCCIFQDSFKYANYGDAVLAAQARNALPLLLDVAEAAQQLVEWHAHGIADPRFPHPIVALEAAVERLTEGDRP